MQVNLAELISRILNKFEVIEPKIDSKTEIVKLWENADISSAFGSQVISINFSGYDKVLIEYLGDAGWSAYYHHIVSVGQKTVLQFHTHIATSGTSEVPYVWGREILVNSDGINFNNCFLRLTGNGSYSSQQNNYAKPYRIYGIKGVQHG